MLQQNIQKLCKSFVLNLEQKEDVDRDTKYSLCFTVIYEINYLFTASLQTAAAISLMIQRCTSLISFILRASSISARFVFPCSTLLSRETISPGNKSPLRHLNFDWAVRLLGHMALQSLFGHLLALQFAILILGIHHLKDVVGFWF